MMKVVLAALNARYIHSNLAIRYIKEYCKGFDIEIFESTINDELLGIAYKITEMNPDVIGFSCYIWNIESTLKVASLIKKMNPNIKLIFGGPEVSFDGTLYMKKYSFIDFIVEGEGEETSLELFKILENIYENNSEIKEGEGDKPFDLSMIQEKKDIKLENKGKFEGEFEGIRGLVFRKNGVIVKNEKRDEFKDLNVIPFPYSDLPDKIIYYEASRGCPFNCTYCLSSTIKGVRYLELNRVINELKFFIDSGVKLVKFVDRTFNAGRYARDIWEFLIGYGGNTSFHFEIAGDILNDEDIKILSKARKGLFQLEIGVQSTNPMILNNINRRMNFNKLKENLNKIKEAGNIHCHLDLIAGLPGEDFTSFKKSFDDCMAMKPDVLQLGFLKVLKGSPLIKSIEEYSMEYMDYPPYQVLSTKDMNYRDIKKLFYFEEVFEDYYNSGIFSITMEYLLDNGGSPFHIIENLYEFILKNGCLGKKLCLNEKFKLILDFAKDSYNCYIIKDLLIHDYIITAKSSCLPEFLKKEITREVKEYVKDNLDIIRERIGDVALKDIFYLPINNTVYKYSSGYNYKKEDVIGVFSIKKGEYTYI